MSIQTVVSVSQRYKNPTSGGLVRSRPHVRLTSSHHDIAEKLLSWRETTITHSTPPLRSTGYTTFFIEYVNRGQTTLQPKELVAQWAEPVSLTFHSALRKLNTEPPIGASHQVLVIWLSSFREENIQKSTNQKQEWPLVAMFINGPELNEQSLQTTFQGCFLRSFDSFG